MSSNLDIAFRVDASDQIGAGHLMRCLALAEALRKQGATCRFLMRRTAAPWSTHIENAGHALNWLDLPVSSCQDPDGPPHAAWLGGSQAADAAATIDALADQVRPSWLVVDHYAIDARWHNAVRGHTARLMAIDDLADRELAVDLLLDQNFHDETHDRYALHRQPNSVALYGPRYALLRTEFSRSGMPTRRADTVQNLLICFGGVAQQAITQRTLQALAGLPELAQLRVTVISPAETHAALAAAAPTGLDLRLLARTDDMAGLMRASDLNIGAGGGMLWERFSQGLPAVVLGIADNQRSGINALLRAGLVSGHCDANALDDADLEALLRSALRSPSVRAGQASRAAALVDGRGAARVARRLLAPALHFRVATAADSATLFSWRNDARVRHYSHDDRPIALDTHERWLAQTLQDSQRHLLIGTQPAADSADKTESVGVVRFDVSGDTALISVYLVPERLQSGLGMPLIDQACQWLHAQRPEIHQIRAEIQNCNSASLASFAGAGFVPQAQTLTRTQE